MSRVVHFEIAVDDFNRARAFYENVLGWRFHKWEGGPEYWLITTGAEGPGIDGGLMARQEGWPSVVNTVDVAAIDDAIAAVTANGGRVVAPKMAVPGVGYLAYCADTEGNVFGMMQNDPNAQM